MYQLAIQKQMEEHPEMASNLDGRVVWEGDALSQVMGKDKNGCVRGLGLLPDPKSVLDPTRRFEGMDITILDEKTLVVLVRELIGKLEKVENRVEELEKQASQPCNVVSYMKKKISLINWVEFKKIFLFTYKNVINFLFVYVGFKEFWKCFSQ